MAETGQGTAVKQFAESGEIQLVVKLCLQGIPHTYCFQEDSIDGVGGPAYRAFFRGTMEGENKGMVFHAFTEKYL